MTLYSLALFVHVTAVLALFACLSLEMVSVFHLRRACSLAEARFWIEPVPGLPAIALGSLPAVVLSGLYLTFQMSGFGVPWAKVTIAALLLVAPLGAVTRRRMRYIRRLSASDHTNDSTVLGLLRDPFLKISLAIRTFVFLGIVLLMTAKPALPESLGILGGSVALGLVAALLVPSQKPALSPADTGVRE
jgi:hypothetical protein